MERERIDWRFIEAPSERPALLDFGQALGVFQAFGLTLETPSAAISLRSSGDFVVLQAGEEPLVVTTRTAWREKLAAWRPVPVLPEKG